MRRILVVYLLCVSMLLSSCAGANEVIPVCPDLTPFTESGHVETEEGYALVDWMIFVRYNGRSYTRDFSEPTVIPENQIGEMLGRVEHNPPTMVPVDYEEPDLLSFGYRIGAPFYAIKDVNPAYEIAVYDADTAEYHRLQYTDYLPNRAQIVRGRLLADYNYPAVRLFETYDALPRDHKEQFPDYDELFFRDNVLAVMYLEEGSGSVSHSVTGVHRVGETIEINIRREIPAVGTCDMAYWAIAAAISREDWDGAAIVPRVSGYDEFPATAKNNAEPFYIGHPASVYVRFLEQIYISAGDHTNQPLAESALGQQLGTVEHEIPEKITAGYQAPDRSAKGFDVGVPIYEVLGMDPDYFIAVPEYAGGRNFLLYRYDGKIPAETKILYDERVREDGELYSVKSRAGLDALFETGTAPDAFAEMDDAFFETKQVVLIPFLSRPQSIQYSIPAVYRMGDDTVFCVQRDIPIPTRGQEEQMCDVILCVILDKAGIVGTKFRLWHTTFSE